MKKILILIVVLGIAVWAIMSYGTPASAPAPEGIDATLSADSTDSITGDIDSTDVGDLDGDFKAIDTDLETL